MRIALLGYGRMGKAIEQIAINRGHEIVLKVDRKTKDYTFSNVDVAIDFSIPTTAYQNITDCINNNIPVVSGTTGWLEDYDKVVALCNEKKGAFIYGSNFSIGVNIFFELNAYLAKLMNGLSSYNVSMEEIHHTKKLDAPSGTAISLADGIIKNYDSKKSWVLESPAEEDIEITAKRIEDVPGTHTIFYKSEVDTLTISHEAHNRQGFALGAVLASEWLVGKTGVYTMKDVLNIK
ncbi:4-hydroxy-tetrahydrodipicolinate reductase [Neptunitalea chrysea]|uniref:4-hydroxy-tetrahydrodipicolinate reductase n=1 Tax=Neptunitalea chrysea TaxID=1647581 RepID=A0A9W6B6R3_9FLAO|nr:4-hydroxy-tetrahydrodipicolinate reductase [Neptunitalea chrysea]GLB52317.1 4-hydroxy-tetrahydrodipicolinate reductase [Neptunitalea chrysea]